MASIIAQAVAFLLLMAVVTACIFGLAYVMGRPDCSAKASKMGFEHDFGVLQGCMIKVSGQWIPIESYRVVD